MTTRKRDIPLPARPPSYVTRDGGAAELSISPETWDNWVDAEVLPAPAAGFPETSPRWRWADVDRRLSGKLDVATDPFVMRAVNLRNGSEKSSRRAAS